MDSFNQAIKPKRVVQRTPTLGNHIEEHKLVFIHSKRLQEKNLFRILIGTTFSHTSLAGGQSLRIWIKSSAPCGRKVIRHLIQNHLQYF